MKKICNILIEIGIISLLIFPPIVFGAVEFRYVTLIHIIVLGIGIVWGGKVLSKGSFSYRPGPFDLPFLGFLVWGAVNLVFSTYRQNTGQALYLWGFYGLFYFLVVQQLKSVRRIVGLAFLLVLIGSGESIFGLLQYLRGAKTVLGYATPNIGTLNATYFNHNHFAGFLILIIPIALGLLVGTANLEKKVFLLVLLGLLGLALVLSLSRGGLLSLLVACVAFFLGLLSRNLHQKGGWGKYIVLLMVFIICVGAVISWIGFSPIAHRSLLESVLPEKETVTQEIRFSLWRNALALVKEFPVFGSGLGTFGFVFMRYCPDQLPQKVQAFYAHNDFLELLVEMGFPALLLVLWGLVRFYRYVLKGYFTHRDPVLTKLTLGGMASCTAMLTHSLFDFNLQIPANALVFVVILALTTATINLMSRRRGRPHSRKTRGRDKTSSPSASGTYYVSASWKFLLLAVCLLMVFLFSFRTHLALTHYSKAKTLQLQYQPLLAIEQHQTAITFNRGNAFLHEALGNVYRELARTTPHGEKWNRLAMEAYTAAITLNSYNPAYPYALGQTYADLGMAQEAVQHFQQAISLNPRVAFYYENLGNYYLSFEQIDLAMEMYRQALQRDFRRIHDIILLCEQHHLSYEQYRQVIPDTPESRQRFAIFLEQQKHWEKSKDQYREAIALAGGEKSYYDGMFSACQRRRDYACLRSLWQELWTKDPENLELPLKIGESFEKQQFWDQAIQHYRTLLQQQPDMIQAQQRLAALYQQHGHGEEAVKLYQEILAAQPENEQAYHRLASLYRQRKEWEQAVRIYENALAVGLTRPAIYGNLGEIYLQQGAPRKALATFQLAVQAGETRFSLYQTMAGLLEKQQDQIAIDLLWETYAVNNRRQPEALFQLVQYYHTEGEWLKAVSLAKEVIANAPTNQTYRKFLATLYEKKDLVYEAIPHWEKLVRLHGQNINYQMHLAGLYEKVNQWDAARRQYRYILRVQPDHQGARRKLEQLDE